jgi:hypothetical protein
VSRATGEVDWNARRNSDTIKNTVYGMLSTQSWVDLDSAQGGEVIHGEAFRTDQ